MSLYGLALYCLVYALSVASPGPGVAAVVARSLTRGARGAPAFIAGFLVGDLIWLTVAATGLAAIAQTAQLLFAAVKYAGAAYLLYLAWRMWIAPAEAPTEAEVDASQKPFRLFLASLSLTLGNPKTMVFFLALLADGRAPRGPHARRLPRDRRVERVDPAACPGRVCRRRGPRAPAAAKPARRAPRQSRRRNGDGGRRRRGRALLTRRRPALSALRPPYAP